MWTRWWWCAVIGGLAALVVPASVGHQASAPDAVPVGLAAAPAPAPTLTFSADPARVSRGQRSTLTWASTDAQRCTASGGWTGGRALAATRQTPPLTVTTTFTLTCTGRGGSVVRSVTVQVAPGPFRVLVFTKTLGYRHESIPVAVEAVKTLGRTKGFAVDTTEDAAAFTGTNLARYQAVIWLMTSGDVLDAAQQTAFETYIRGGGGYVGVHSASDTEYGWPWYGALLGGYFAGHPAIQSARVVIQQPRHPATAALPATWTRTDEWYNVSPTPRGKVRVLATLDETSYTGGTMGGDHPIIWCQNYQGGRSFYTAGGHTEQSYSEPEFLNHLLGGIRWAAGRAGSQGTADCSVPNR